MCGGRDIKKGGAGLECRDPLSYVIPNENRDLVWRPYLENIGGSTPSSGTQNSSDAIHRSTPGPQLTGPTNSTISRNPPGERPAPFVADLSSDSQGDDRSL